MRLFVRSSDRYFRQGGTRVKKKSIKIAVIALCTLLILWCAMFFTDYVRCGSLKEPIFVIAAGETADDGGSGTCRGLGYRVEIEKHIDAEYGVCIDSVEMWMFGRVISASIT